MEPESLQPNQVQLWSSHRPNLPVGDYTFTATQTIQPTSDLNDLRQLSKLTQSLSVPGPKFKLLHSSDIHSVYPVAGSIETGAILPHVTLKHSTLAWERQVVFDGDYKPDDSNKVPWLAVLSFTEDELILSATAAATLGFPSGSVPSRYGTIATTPGQLKLLNNTITSPLRSSNFDDDYADTDPVDALCIQPTLFKELFQPVTGGKACNDIVPYQFMAHVRHSHSSSDIISIVISPRSGPTELIKPARMVSHLISLEGIPRLDVSSSASSVALVSLYSWDWMCTPPAGPTTPKDILNALGKTVQPLCVPKTILSSIGTSSTSSSWIHDRLEAGYTIKPYQDASGNKATCILRGPLIPVPGKLDPSFESCCSDNGKDLLRFDSATGLPDITMQSAWTLGRAMALGDKSFLASLMRLRGKIRAEAVRAAKAASRDASGTGSWTSKDILANLATSLASIAKAHSDSAHSAVTGPVRWTNQQASSQLQQRQQIVSFAHFDQATYLKQLGLGTVVDALFAATTLDADASVVQSWILGKLLLGDIPPSYLVMTPDQFPQESIRTFSVDSTWVALMIDGALSLANHHSPDGDDDVIRKYIKDAINKWLTQPLPDEHIIQQPPRWGVLLRSSVVSSFPDLKVVGSSTAYYDPSTSKPFLLRRVAPDIMLCLSDFRPGDSDFAYLCISLPIHRQTYQLGETFTASELGGDFKLPPTSSAPSTYGKDGTCQWTNTDHNLPYNWTTRMLDPLSYAQQIYSKLNGSSSSIDSTTLALFLGRPTPSLMLEVGKLTGSPPATPPPYLPVTLPSLTAPSSPSKSTKGSVNSKKSFSKAKASSTLKRSPVASSTQTISAIANPNITLVLLDSSQAYHYGCPRVTNISDIFTPRERKRLSTLNKTGSQSSARNDIVFTLYDDFRRNGQDPNMNEGVEYIRVVIPVTGTWLQSNETITLPAVEEASGSKTDVSVDVSQPTLLFIPGSLASPVLPAVRSLDQSQQWTFRRYLALSRMYTAPEPADGSQVSVSSDDPVVSVLVVEGKPRFDLAGGYEDASFVLEGALLLPTKSSNPYVLAGVGVNIIFKAKDSAVQELLVNVQHVESHDTS